MALGGLAFLWEGEQFDYALVQECRVQFTVITPLDIMLRKH